MTVSELIEKLKSLPKDYHVIFESGDASVNDIEIKHKDNEIELKRL